MAQERLKDEPEILKPTTTSSSSPPSPPPPSPPSPAAVIAPSSPPPPPPQLVLTPSSPPSPLFLAPPETWPPSRQDEHSAASPPPPTASNSGGCGGEGRSVRRCSSCKKRVGLTGFRCRCGEVFCGRHRYSDAHDCSFDYKAAGRAEISKANPLVRAAKIIKI